MTKILHLSTPCSFQVKHFELADFVKHFELANFKVNSEFIDFVAFIEFVDFLAKFIRYQVLCITLTKILHLSTLALSRKYIMTS